MKIAYLASRYPAVSHTFITREILALRGLGVRIETYSVREVGSDPAFDDVARAELERTGHLVPVGIGELLASCLWCLTTRLASTLLVIWDITRPRGLGRSARVKWICYFAEAAVLARRLVRGGVTRLHCHFGNSGASTGLLAARLAGVRFSMTCHGSELRSPESYRLAEKVAQADFVACVSHFGRAQLMLATPPAQWSKLHVVRCGVSPPSAPPHSPSATLRILCVARLSPEKGHMILLDALATLAEHAIDFRCTLVGDGPERAAIASRVAALSLGGRVALTGAMSPADVQAQYPMHDVVVLGSLAEGVPVVLMEAMSHRLPVVATWVGGVAELVEHGVSGQLVPPSDATALAKAIESLARRRGEHAAMGAAGAQRVNEEFSLPACVEPLAKLLQV